MDVRIVNLKRYFGKTKAVDDISFEFSSGHIFGFVGPNGAGKTTTMRILATLDDPTEGNAYVNGVSLVDDPEKARTYVGFMPDTLPAHRDMTVHEYLDFFARAYGLRGVKRRAVVDSVEQFTNLKGIRDKLLRALSKGMKQRVSLARAIVHDPPVLVLDEPAAGLDPARPRRAARAAEGAGRPRQGDPHQLPHPHRAGRNLQRRGDHRAGQDSAGRVDGADHRRRVAAADDRHPRRRRRRAAAQGVAATARRSARPAWSARRWKSRSTAATRPAAPS